MDERYFSLINLVLATVFVQISGQGDVCGPFVCVENAECLEGQCSCKTGFVGYGRFICVPGDQCPCAAFGDPHILQFDQGVVHTVLPCQFILAGFTTATGCNIQVEIITYHRPNQKYPLRAFTKMLKVKATRDNTILEYTLGSSGLSPAMPVGTTDPLLPDNNAGIDITVMASTYNNYIRTVLPECDNTNIAFDPGMLASAIGTPKTGTFPNTGVCGNCNGNADDNSFLSMPNITPQEADMALSLRELSADQSTSDSTACSAIRTNANGCSDDQELVKAVKCCGFLYDSDFARCLELEPSVNRQDLLRITKECLSFYCVEKRRNVAAVYVPVMTQLFGCGNLTTNYMCP